MFKKWMQKIRLLLKTKDKSALNRLPEACRWLRYWGTKLREEEPSNYAKVERIEKDLLSKAGDALQSSYLSYLKKAQTHRKGTKVRLTEILRYVYHYGNYVHSCFIAGEKEDKARETLGSFWKDYLNEITDYVESLNDDQIRWLLRLIKQSREVGVKIQNQLVSKLEAITKQPSNRILLEQSENQLKEAEENLDKNETITALILADQSLELFLKDLCMRWGCERDTRRDSRKPFHKWGVIEYLRYLDEIGEIDEIEKNNLQNFHEWRNCAQHKGLEPSARSVRRVIDEITEFMRKNLD